MSQSAVECVVWSEPAVDASPRDARHFHTPRRAVIAGYVLLNHAPTMYIPGGGECAYIASIAVCPHWQRRHIASRLITCAKRLAVRRGSFSICLLFDSNEQSLCDLYRHAEFLRREYDPVEHDRDASTHERWAIWRRA